MSSPFEMDVRAWMEKQGWTTLSRGWPDFLCWVERPEYYRRAICIEAKTDADDLRPEQKVCHRILRSAGLPVLTVRPSDLTGSKNLAGVLVRGPTAFTDIKHALRSLQSEVKRQADEISRLNGLLDRAHSFLDPT